MRAFASGCSALNFDIFDSRFQVPRTAKSYSVVEDFEPVVKLLRPQRSSIDAPDPSGVPKGTQSAGQIFLERRSLGGESRATMMPLARETVVEIIVRGSADSS